MQHGFPIKVAAKRTGLSTHLIRAWENRYGAVNPSRSGTSRRLYTEEDIARLTLLRLATSAGHSIGNIAKLSDEALRHLAAEAPLKPVVESQVVQKADIQNFLEDAFRAVVGLDSAALDRILQEALVRHGRATVMHQLLTPLIQRIGDAWQNGELRVAQEHVASAVIRTFLGNFVRAHSETSGAPKLLVTTPAGQIHELGALLAAASATDQGWRVTYLGPNLPADEIAGAFQQNDADALVLSLIYPGDDPALPQQLHLIRQLLPKGSPILAGGRAAMENHAVLDAIGAVLCSDMPALIRELNRLRAARRSVGN